MKNYALIGKDILYSKSEILHKAIMQYCGVSGDFKIFSIDYDRLPSVIYKLRQSFDGFNVTKPYKIDIINYLDQNFSPVGAVNTVKVEDGKLIGYNTDGLGFMGSLEFHGIDAEGKTVLILGAGGAAHAIAYELDKIAKVYIYNRTVKKAEELISSLSLKNTAVANLSKVTPHIIINATTLGLNNEMSLPDGVKLNNLEAVCDTIYNPSVTPILEWASERKFKAINGATMLVIQALEAQKIWQGIEVGRDEVKKLTNLVEGV